MKHMVASMCVAHQTPVLRYTHITQEVYVGIHSLLNMYIYIGLPILYILQTTGHIVYVVPHPYLLLNIYMQLCNIQLRVYSVVYTIAVYTIVVYTVAYTVYMLQCITYTVDPTVQVLQCRSYSVDPTVQVLQCRFYSVDHTLQIIQYRSYSLFYNLCYRMQQSGTSFIYDLQCE